MKRFICIMLMLCLVLGTGGCSLSSEEDNGKLNIIATIFPQYDFARQIAGDKANVSMLITPGTESHSFEPTTSDMLDISKCDIFIYTGGESDSWIDDLLKNIDNPDMKIISLLDCIDIEQTDHNHDDHQGHNHGTIDEHVWTSPVNAIEISKHIAAIMCEKDSTNADTYNANLEDFIAQLSALDANFRDVVNNAERNTLVFGDRFPLKHFTDEYGLNYHAAFSGCSDDTEAIASTIADLIDIVKEQNIPVVMKIELSSDATARTICEETGTQMMTFYSCHNISKDDFDSGATYISLMELNTDTLSTALN